MELPSLRAYLFSALWTYRFPNLPYRRFPIGRTVASSEALEAAKRLRVRNPRYSRFGNLLLRGRHAKHLPAGFAARQLLRSEEHTSELQSRFDLVCRLLLEKKKK